MYKMGCLHSTNRPPPPEPIVQVKTCKHSKPKQNAVVVHCVCHAFPTYMYVLVVRRKCAWLVQICALEVDVKMPCVPSV